MHDTLGFLQVTAQVRKGLKGCSKQHADTAKGQVIFLPVLSSVGVTRTACDIPSVLIF